MGARAAASPSKVKATAPQASRRAAKRQAQDRLLAQQRRDAPTRVVSKARITTRRLRAIADGHDIDAIAKLTGLPRKDVRGEPSAT